MGEAEEGSERLWVVAAVVGFVWLCWSAWLFEVRGCRVDGVGGRDPIVEVRRIGGSAVRGLVALE